MIHAAVVLLALVSLAGVLAYLPMPAMAALLIMVAWNMSEAPKAVHLLKTAPRSDVLVFLTCFSLTVALDMVIAITTGVLLAAVLFMREMAEMTKVTDITSGKRISEETLPAGWRVFKINGPLFFAAADRIFGELAELSRNVDGFILYMDGVTVLDAGGLSALNKLITTCQNDGTRIVIADLQSQPQRTLARGGLGPVEGVLQFTSSLREALALPLSSTARQSSTLSAPTGSNG
jgi:SulP family sulfate permease